MRDKAGDHDLRTIDALLASLTEDARVRDVQVGAFWTAVVLDTDPPRCGLASTLRPESHGDGAPVSGAGSLLERSGRELAAFLRSPSVIEASIGMAAYNALLEVDERSCTEVNAAEIILERGAGRHVAIVGHFPFVDRVRKVAASCLVIEKRPMAGDAPPERASEILPAADVVAITGTSLINHTFDGLLDLCRPGAFVILLGGSAPMTPLLLDLGIAAIAGTRVTDVEAAVRAVAQGANFPQIRGKRLLTLAREQ
jgi:uncharacterized protein